jgi:YVTN family beta-propeller protein
MALGRMDKLRPILTVLAMLLLLSLIMPYISARPASAQTIIGTIKLGEGGYSPWDVAVNPSTNRIYTSDLDSNTVSVIDGASDNVVATVSVGANPYGVVVNPSTNRIYTADTGSNTVSVIDGTNNNVVATVSTGASPWAVAVNPATNRIYTVHFWSSDTVSVIDGATNSVVTTISVGNTPFDIAVNSSTNRIYTANFSSNTVSVIDGASNSVVATVLVGQHPASVAVNPSTNRIYVANSGSNTVSVIDGASNSVVATVSLGHQPEDVAVNLSTNRIYVPIQGGNILLVIDGATNSVVTTIPVGLAPTGVAVNPDTNRIYMTKPLDNIVSVVDGASNNVVATVSVGDGPWDVAVNPATNQIYVANPGSNTVSVIDGASNSVVTTVPVLIGPSGVAVNPSTNRIYTANHAGAYFSIIDGATNNVVATVLIGIQPYYLAVNPTTNRIYTANYNSNTVSVIDGASNSVVATIPVGNNQKGITVNPTTNRIYTANYSSNTVSVIDGASDNVVATVSVGDGPYGVVVNPSTNRIYTADTNINTVSVIDGATNSVVATVPVGSHPQGVAVNPSTNRIYTANYSSNTVSVIDGAANSVVATVPVGSGPMGVAVNPNTNRIYVANYLADTVSVIWDPGPGPQPVASLSYSSPHNPVWSGDVVQFDASGSTPQGKLTYAWDFGDGESAMGMTTTHRFRGAVNQPKSYAVKLTIEDNNGNTNTASVSIVVNPLQKLVDVSPGYTGISCWMRTTYNWVGLDDATGENLYIISKIESYSGGFVGTYQLFVLRRVSPRPSIPRVIWYTPLTALPVLNTYSTPFEPSKWQELWGIPAKTTKVTSPDGVFEGIGVTDTSLMVIVASGSELPPFLTFFDIGMTKFDSVSPVTHPVFEALKELSELNDVLGLVHMITGVLFNSPGEFRMYDSSGRVTGLVNGEVKTEIPSSTYVDETIAVFHPSDNYHYEVSGTGEGTYGLIITSIEDGEATTFTATDIPTTSGAVHQYTIDWEALAQGKAGVTVQVDANGDGRFEVTFTSDGELTGDEFMSHTRTMSPVSPVPHVSSTINTAQLSVQYLNINPQQVYTNQPVTISINVVNTGGQAGNYNLTLKINGQVERTKMVSIGPQGTQPVKFTVVKSQPGTYTVDIGGQKGSFTILGARSNTDSHQNGGLIAFLIMGALVLVTAVALILTYRRPA